jgi:hypothetical protein
VDEKRDVEPLEPELEQDTEEAPWWVYMLGYLFVFGKLALILGAVIFAIEAVMWAFEKVWPS